MLIPGRRKSAVTLLTTLLMVLAVSGCGFHLRGTIELPPQFDTIYIEDLSESAIMSELRSLLKRNQIKEVEEMGGAKVVIELDNEKYNRRILTVSSAGNVEEYELTYSLKYSIRQRKKDSDEIKILLQNESVKLKRDLRFDENAVLAKSTEEDELRLDMLRTAAEQIIRRLYKLKDITT